MRQYYRDTKKAGIDRLGKEQLLLICVVVYRNDLCAFTRGVSVARR
jgi:hypothetical protein